MASSHTTDLQSQCEPLRSAGAAGCNLEDIDYTAGGLRDPDRHADQAGGLRLTDEGSMLGELVKAVLERALEAELTAHLGYGKHDPAGHHSGTPATARSPRPCRPGSGENARRPAIRAQVGDPETEERFLCAEALPRAPAWQHVRLYPPATMTVRP